MATTANGELSPIDVGTELGEFRVTGPPKRDGDSFDAVDAEGRPVTVSLVEREVAEEPGFARRFRRLARARMQLDHPNLLPVRAWGKTPLGLYLVMERSEAPTLAQRLRAGPLDVPTSVRLLGEVADALEAAHAAGVVARALTPQDIRLEGGRPLLGDLGIGRPLHPGRTLVVGGSVRPPALRPRPASGGPLRASDRRASGVDRASALSAGRDRRRRRTSHGDGGQRPVSHAGGPDAGGRLGARFERHSRDPPAGHAGFASCQAAPSRLLASRPRARRRRRRPRGGDRRLHRRLA